MTPETPRPAPAQNMARMFLDRVATTPDAEAFRHWDGAAWVSVTWAASSAYVSRLAAGLIALGLEAEQRVAIAAGTRYEWVAADLAIVCAGAATTTIYPTTMAGDVAFIVADSGSRVVFAEDDDQIAKLRAHRADLPDVQKVVTFDGTPDGDWVIGLADLEDAGQALLAREPDTVLARAAGIAPDQLATLVYTSGTTGRPKGVRLSHAAWAFEGSTTAGLGFLNADDLEYRWLPMSHVFGKVLCAAQLVVGYPCVIDGRVEAIIDNLAVVRPTFMGAAPRIFEKAWGRIVTTAEQAGGAKLAVFRWAFSIGRRYSDAVLAGGRPGLLVAAQYRLADALVFTTIRQRFGGRLRFFLSGAAALSPDLARSFHAAGILILEGWGMTELSAGATVNRPDDFRFGTVGKPLPGCRVRIAADGEILVQGPNVMDSYHGDPAATEAAFTVDGWLMTGDVGEQDEDGFLRITDRKKDLFKTSGGKYVAPSAIEGLVKALCPYVSQVLVHGNDRHFVSALLTLDADAITAWAADHGLAGAPYPAIVRAEVTRTMLQGYVDSLNERLNRWETVKRFVVLEADFSVETGELTPSMKVKRKVVEQRHRAELDALYT